MRIDDTDLLAFADDRLPEPRRAEVEAAVAGSPELTAQLAALRASALPYSRAFEAQALPPVPPELSRRVAALAAGSAARAKGRGGAPWGRIAASFAAGALCSAAALKLLSPGAALLGNTQPTSPWIRAVAEYQELYSRATLANVTEDPRLSERVISDLSLADGIAVRVPDLRGAGLAFKRVQRLTFHQQAVVQMAYLPEQGEPVALCVTRDGRPDEGPHAQQIGELQTVAWRRAHLGYVLLGRGPTRELLDLGQGLARGDSPVLYSAHPRAAAEGA
jgi:anti-sigma factor RsiW